MAHAVCLTLISSWSRWHAMGLGVPSHYGTVLIALVPRIQASGVRPMAPTARAMNVHGGLDPHPRGGHAGRKGAQRRRPTAKRKIAFMRPSMGRADL